MEIRKYVLFYLALAIFLFVALPWLLLGGSSNLGSMQLGESPNIRVLIDGQVEEMEVERFLVGVVAAEMPAAFPEAALAAQAIAARSYIYAHSPLNEAGDGSRHEGAAVCDDPACCQAYRTEAEMRESWGENMAEYLAKIETAVAETHGQILTYDGQVAEAPYSSTCGGQTEDVSSLWGSERPWLKSVECKWDQESPSYESEAEFSLAEAAALLSLSEEAVAAAAVQEKTASGRVATVDFGGNEKSANSLRELLGLKSTDFTMQVADGQIHFSVHGYGHGVGLCQYGAGGMAKEGYSYADILKHYYSGIQIECRY